MGKRTTGAGPGNFLIVGPNWQGTTPPDMRSTFRSPTRYALLLGQTQANGPSDFAAVNAIQAQYKLTPLSAWGKPYTPADTNTALRSTEARTAASNAPEGGTQ